VADPNRKSTVVAAGNEPPPGRPMPPSVTDELNQFLAAVRYPSPFLRNSGLRLNTNPNAYGCRRSTSGSLRFRLLPTDVGGLAPGIDAGRAFDRLLLLADALLDRGSADEQVIGYCRSEGAHILRCRVVARAVGES
jgi:hypothetical protein